MDEVELSVNEDSKPAKRKLFIGYYRMWTMLTYLSIVSAIAGMAFALNGDIVLAIICLMACGLCDMLDGPVARRSKRNEREKSFGVQVDSLADLVNFGALPIVIGYALGFSEYTQENYTLRVTAFIVVAVIYVLAALIRLAYFNTIEIELQQKKEKRKYYVGMPVTFISVLTPLTYTICYLINAPFAFVYPAVLLATAVAFLSRIKIPKIKERYLVVYLLIGLPLVVFMVWSLGN